MIHSARLTVLLFASLGLAACDSTGDATVPVGTTSTTSAELDKQTQTQFPDGLACARPAEDPELAACDSTAAAPRVAAPRVVTVAPVTGIAYRRARANPRADTPTQAAAPEANSAGLDDAIRAEVAAEHHDATPARPTVSLTTTSGLVPAPVPAAAPSRVTFVSQLPKEYQLQRVRMFVDGASAYDAPTPGTLQLSGEHHTVQVLAEYKLKDSFFTYVDDYGVRLEGTHDVPATTGTPVDFVVRAVPTGGVTTPLDKRAALAWREGVAR